MRKLIFLFLFFPLTVSAITLKQNTAYSPGVSIGQITSTTDGTIVSSVDVSSVSAWFRKAGTATEFTLTASGGNNDLVSNGNGFYSLELTASDTDTLGELSIEMTQTGRIIPPRHIEIVPYLPSDLADIIVASGKIIPVTGGLLDKIDLVKSGDSRSYRLLASVLSQSATAPDFQFMLIQRDSYSLTKTTADMTYTVHSAPVTVLDVTPILHEWYLDIESLADGEYTTVVTCDSNGHPTARTGTLVVDATPTFEDSSAVLAKWDALETSLLAIKSGSGIRQATGWAATEDIERPTAEQSDQYSTYIPQYETAFIEVSVTNDFDGSTAIYLMVNDFSETSDKISKPCIPVTAYSTRAQWMAARGIEDASLTVAGGQY